jgi:phosphate transport system substrate-binding protein
MTYQHSIASSKRASLKRRSAVGVACGLLCALGAVEAGAQAARDYISIVGSSTVFPFSTVVAERFGRATPFKTPKIESTGSGGGLKLFCNGVGVQHPDIANSSRRIKASEVEQCARNNVRGIIEIKIGYDGIAIANSSSAPVQELTLRDVYLALAKNVPDPSGSEKLVRNPYRTWSDIDASLPSQRIEVYGPPPTSGTRDAFVELAMEGGCKAFDWVAALGEADYQAACHTIREDSLYIEAGENDNLIVQKLAANPNAFGIFGFSFLDQNSDKVQGSKIDGVAPTFDTVADGDYPISRPLYFYVKKQHVQTIPGIREFLEEFIGEDAAGDFGYLSDKGLIPLPEDEREQMAERIETLEVLEPAELTSAAR